MIGVEDSYKAGYEDGARKAVSLSKVSFCRSCRHFGIDGKPGCGKFGFTEESMKDGIGFCYWGDRA